MKILPFLIAAAVFIPFSALSADWRTADRSSTGIAPLPADEKRAIVQVYTARAFNWRRYFAVHSWIATKDKNADHYTVYQVVGWNTRMNKPVVMAERDLPDRKWYDESPTIIFDARGETAEKMIPQIQAASKAYFYQKFYRLWPGPNSNSYIAHLIRHTHGMTVELPPHAIGKDWIGQGDFFARSESGTGYQFSLYGLFGVTLGLAEGFEVNILGMTFGLDILSPALKLPFIGRIGMKDRPV